MIKKGFMLSLLTACVSGVSVFANSVFVSKADPIVFSIIRNSFVVLLLTALLWGRGHLKDLGKLKKKEWGMLMAIGAIGGGIPFALFFTGLSKIGAVNGNILHKTLFLWVALLAVPFLKERISRIQLTGYLTVFASLFILGGSFKFVPATGSYLVLAATVMWAIENVIAKKTLQNVSYELVAWGRMIFGLPFLLLSALALGKTGLLFAPVSYAAAPITVSSVLLVAYVLSWYGALSLAPATMVSSILVLAPIVTALLGWAMLSKSIPTPQIVSYSVLCIGVCIIAANQIKDRLNATPTHG